MRDKLGRTSMRFAKTALCAAMMAVAGCQFDVVTEDNGPSADEVTGVAESAFTSSECGALAGACLAAGGVPLGCSVSWWTGVAYEYVCQYPFNPSPYEEACANNHGSMYTWTPGIADIGYSPMYYICADLTY